MVVVVVVVMGVVDGRGDCGRCFGCFFFFYSGVYNFIIGKILFYYDVYIILLC